MSHARGNPESCRTVYYETIKYDIAFSFQIRTVVREKRLDKLHIAGHGGHGQRRQSLPISLVKAL